MRGALLAALLGATAAFAADRADVLRAFGLGEGLSAVHTGLPEGDEWARAEDCGACHEKQLLQWRKSRHAVAFTNPIFQAGLIREPSLRCVHCHAPRAEQERDVRAALPRGRFSEVRARLIAEGTVAVSGASPAQDGVDCLTCHVREGRVLTKKPADAAGHAVDPRAEMLSTAEFCSGCHQFRFNGMQHGALVLTDVAIQSTHDEWRAWAGKESCLDCHAVQDPHNLQGAHDPGFPRDALDVRVEQGALVLKAQYVGHRLPTGDLFRHLTVEARVAGAWTVLASIGRSYESRTIDGVASMVLASDTTMAPDEVRRVPLPGAADRVRVRYHYVSAEAEERSDVPEALQAVTLHELSAGSR